MEQDLISFFTTKTQANEFMARLTAVEEQIYETHFSLEKAINKQLGIQKSDKFLKLMREQNVAETPTSIKDFFEKVKKTIASLPTISMTIAFEPTDNSLSVLTDWFIINCKKQFLFDITVNQHLIAGAIIKYNGQFIDCTSKPVFDAIIKNSMEVKPKPTATAAPSGTTSGVEHFHMGR